MSDLDSPDPDATDPSSIDPDATDPSSIGPDYTDPDSTDPTDLTPASDGAGETALDEQFGQGAPGTNGSPVAGQSDLRRLSDVPMELSVEIGRTQITVGETLQLHAGSVITLDRLAGEPVDVLVNGTPIARGEVVVVDEQFGLRVTQIGDGERAAAETTAQAPQDTPDGEQTQEA
jgi:flagellar motor switch protein FliN